MQPQQLAAAAQLANMQAATAAAMRATFAKDILCAFISSVGCDWTDPGELPREHMGTVAAAAVAMADELLEQLGYKLKQAAKY